MTFIDRHPAAFVVLILAGVPLGTLWFLFAVFCLVDGSVYGVVAFVILMAIPITPVLMVQGRRRRLARQALADRADYEHHAILRGDIDRGVYGRFPIT